MALFLESWIRQVLKNTHSIIYSLPESATCHCSCIFTMVQLALVQAIRASADENSICFHHKRFSLVEMNLASLLYIFVPWRNLALPTLPPFSPSEKFLDPSGLTLHPVSQLQQVYHYYEAQKIVPHLDIALDFFICGLW